MLFLLSVHDTIIEHIINSDFVKSHLFERVARTDIHEAHTGLYSGYLALGVAIVQYTDTLNAVGPFCLVSMPYVPSVWCLCRRSLLSGVYAVGPFCLVSMP